MNVVGLVDVTSLTDTNSEVLQGERVQQLGDAFQHCKGKVGHAHSVSGIRIWSSAHHHVRVAYSLHLQEHVYMYMYWLMSVE